VSDVPRLCPSCAGQLGEKDTEVCPWCGAGAVGPTEATKATTAPSSAEGPSPLGARGAGRGLGDAALPPGSLPPPPKHLPITRLDPGQIFLRTLIILGLAYVIVVIGHRALQVFHDALPAIAGSGFGR